MPLPLDSASNRPESIQNHNHNINTCQRNKADAKIIIFNQNSQNWTNPTPRPMSWNLIKITSLESLSSHESIHAENIEIGPQMIPKIPNLNSLISQFFIPNLFNFHV